ncbi:MAG: STAS domain-containing protein [Verrucomicrobiales bacterium]
MNSPSVIYVASSDAGVFVRVVGKGCYQNSPPLRRFMQQLLQEGAGDLYVDLGACRAMDSTFLGVLAGFGLGLRRSAQPHGTLCLFNVNDAQSASLQTLGLDRLAQIACGRPPLEADHVPAEAQYHVLPGTELTAQGRPQNKIESTECMLEAHENLCAADERNQSKFADVTRFLRQEITEQQKKAEEKPSLP